MVTGQITVMRVSLLVQLSQHTTVMTQHRNSSYSSSCLPAASPCPVGLYCVIEEFLTEYDTRLLEEEQRAELLASRTKQIS